MSSRVNIMEIENFLFTAKVENLLTAKSSMWRQDDNNDKKTDVNKVSICKNHIFISISQVGQWIFCRPVPSVY